MIYFYEISLGGNTSMAKLKTGRHTSALKELRKANVRTLHNDSIKSRIRSLSKNVEAAVKGKDSTLAKSLLKSAFSQWDKAAKTNVIHSNAAANQKARLAKMVGSLSAAK
jgi:small subunit ribosomal protein S20